MTANESNALTIGDLMRIKKQYEAENPDPLPVAVVARPEYYVAIASMCLQSARPDSLTPYGLPVYTDSRQQESWKLFYDWEELKAYLNRP
jgi:hypothetical protein